MIGEDFHFLNANSQSIETFEKVKSICPQFDFIFIDGLHTYEQLTKDCHNYYSKVKTGGIFSGHDYQTIPGVNKAVCEFAPTKTDNVLTTECDVWYWYK